MKKFYAVILWSAVFIFTTNCMAFAEEEACPFSVDGKCSEEISKYLESVESCNHWAGEEPYDDARGAEIEAALKELNCEKLGCDFQNILKEHADVEQQLRDYLEEHFELGAGSYALSCTESQ